MYKYGVNPNKSTSSAVAPVQYIQKNFKVLKKKSKIINCVKTSSAKMEKNS